MKYKKINIVRYKAINSPIEIDLTKNSLIPIIGINECGKTTILNAIFAFDHNNDQFNNSIKQITDVQNLYSTQIGPAIISAIIEIDEQEFKDIYNDFVKEKIENYQPTHRYKPSQNNKFPGEIIITREISNSDSSYSIDQKQLIRNPVNENDFCTEIINHTPYILYFDDFKDSFPDKIEIKESSDDLSSWASIIEELFHKTDPNYSIYDLGNLEKRQRNNILLDVEKKLNDTLTKEWANFRLDDRDALVIKIAFEKVEEPEKKVDTKSSWPNSNQITKVEKQYLAFEVVEKNPEGKERTFYVRDRSKGFYWFFNFVMKLEFNPKVVYHFDQTHNNTIYLLDEPGSYLHPLAQRKLCKKLIDLSADNKVIYCTHTHYLLDPSIVPINTIHIAEKSNFCNIRLLKANDFPKNDESLQSAFQPILDALYINPFNLDFTYKKMLIVEGIYDFYCFSLFRSSNDYGILPGKGASGLFDLISIMIGFDIDFKVLWDNDTEGLGNMETAAKYFGDEIAEDHFRTLQLSGRNGKIILQDLFEGQDLNMIRHKLGLDNNSSFRKTISTLYYSPSKSLILEAISRKTKERFAQVLTSLEME
ncbi:MAG TPA: AAA family ATPase [Flavisolibacter sp.]|nr:AAA family ATPase [Flavisolibacter sp.]